MSLFNDSTTTSSATTSANTPCDLWSVNVPGGSVPLHNAMAIRADGQVYEGTGGLKVTLNGQTIFDLGDSGPCVVVMGLTIWRISANAGCVSGTVAVGGGLYPIPPSTVTGLNWQAAQTLKIVGTSSVTGGVMMDRAGVQR